MWKWKKRILTNPKPKNKCPFVCPKKLYDEIAQWAEDDFRSMNGQIEYLLTECVKRRKGKKDSQEE